jgi:hypothetical protein
MDNAMTPAERAFLLQLCRNLRRDLLGTHNTLLSDAGPGSKVNSWRLIVADHIAGLELALQVLGDDGQDRRPDALAHALGEARPDLAEEVQRWAKIAKAMDDERATDRFVSEQVNRLRDPRTSQEVQQELLRLLSGPEH